MMEPTYRQHKLLEDINEEGYHFKDEDDNLDLYYELVRAGYLQNLCVLPSGWKFILTDEAEKYLLETNDKIT